MMDRNALTGIILMTVMFVIYYVFIVPMTITETPADGGQPTVSVSPTDQAPAASQPQAPAVPDSQQVRQLDQQYGAYAPLMRGENQTLTLRTDKLTLEFDTRGGVIRKALLNEHKTWEERPLPLIAGRPADQFYFEFIPKGSSVAIRSDKLLFSPQADAKLAFSGDESGELRFRASLDENRYIEQVYSFKGNSHNVGYQINFVGLANDLKNPYYELSWTQEIPRTEKALTSQRQKTQIVYMRAGDHDRLGGMSNDPETENLDGSINWVSYKSQFFSSALISAKPLRSASLSVVTPAEDSTAKYMESKFWVDMNERDPVSNFTLYMGPNEYNSMRNLGVDLQKSMDLGYWGIRHINIASIYVFKFLEPKVRNYGIIILIFAIIVKLLVFPMVYSSYVSMAKMRVINATDEMKEIDAKHKDDMQKATQEKMAIYRQMGVSPTGGCVPMLLQWPILISMFFFFPQAVELRHQSFLWAPDLSTYDSVLDLPFSIPGYGDHVSLFTILMTISIYIYTYFQQKSQPVNTQMPFMKYLPYIMPVIFLFFLNSYASGLSWYYLLTNFISIAQTSAIRAMLDDEKLLSQMHALRKAGGKKPSKMGSKLNNWMEGQQKKQQEILRQRQDAANKNRSSRRRNDK